MLLVNILFVFVLFHGSDANKLCCSTPFKIQGFLDSMSFGHPSVPYKIMSGPIEITDGRRATIKELIVDTSNLSPFGFWVALHKDHKKDSWVEGKGIKMMENYRDKLVRLAVSNLAGHPCTRWMPMSGKEDTIVMLPPNLRWKDIFWFGVYDYGSMSLVNHVYIQNPNRTEEAGTLDKLNQCLVKSCWRKNNDPKFCEQELKPCSDPNIDCADSEKKYCYFQCEKHSKTTPTDEEKKRCSKDRKETLFGCSGTTTKEAAKEFCD